MLLAILMQGAQVLTGNVIADGRPLPQVQVVARSRSAPVAHGTVTGPDGRVVDGLAAGDFALQVDGQTRRVVSPPISSISAKTSRLLPPWFATRPRAISRSASCMRSRRSSANIS